MHFIINSLKKAVSKVAQTGTEITTPNSYCEMFYKFVEKHTWWDSPIKPCGLLILLTKDSVTDILKSSLNL